MGNWACDSWVLSDWLEVFLVGLPKISTGRFFRELNRLLRENLVFMVSVLFGFR